MKERDEEPAAKGSQTSKLHQGLLSQNPCTIPQKKTSRKNNRKQVSKYRIEYEYCVSAHHPLLLSFILIEQLLL